MKEKKYIVFTGGGSGGHVVPALTLIEELQKRGDWSISYIGSEKGIEREWVEKQGVLYHPISTGKLRRYWSRENFVDIFRVFWGVVQAWFLLKRPAAGAKTLVFSTGGFVAVPVILSAWLRRHHIFIHEQTSRAGLANRIGALFAESIFVTFESSCALFPRHKVFHSGYPLRQECFDTTIRRTQFGERDISQVQRPILFVTGGGNGSRLLNEKVKDSLPVLTEKYFVVHQVGKAFIDEYHSLKSEHYLPLALIEEGMIDLYKMAAVVLSRAGAGVVCELMAMGKRSIFVPLAIAQKNEQYHNALEAKRILDSWVMEEKDFRHRDLRRLLDTFLDEASEGMTKIKKPPVEGTSLLLSEIEKSL